MIHKIGAYAISLLLLAHAHAASLVPPHTLQACIACHGTTGKASSPAWPNIGGQHANYLYKQLMEMKQGKGRSASVMQATLAALTPNELQALADYYAKQPLVPGMATSKNLSRGETLYRGGDLKQHISACMACHGPGGEGNAQAGFPALSGQNAPYTIQQLQAFQNKTRTQDYNHMMQDIAHRMNPQEMLTVANYIQGLHP